MTYQDPLITYSRIRNSGRVWIKNPGQTCIYVWSAFLILKHPCSSFQTSPEPRPESTWWVIWKLGTNKTTKCSPIFLEYTKCFAYAPTFECRGRQKNMGTLNMLWLWWLFLTDVWALMTLEQRPRPGQSPGDPWVATGEPLSGPRLAIGQSSIIVMAWASRHGIRCVQTPPPAFPNCDNFITIAIISL